MEKVFRTVNNYWKLIVLVAGLLVSYGAAKATFFNVKAMAERTSTTVTEHSKDISICKSQIEIIREDLSVERQRDVEFQKEVRADIKELLRRVH